MSHVLSVDGFWGMRCLHAIPSDASALHPSCVCVCVCECVCICVCVGVRA